MKKMNDKHDHISIQATARLALLTIVSHVKPSHDPEMGQELKYVSHYYVRRRIRAEKSIYQII